MDTKLTKFKYSFTAKLLCLILSCLTFFSFLFFSATVIEGTQIYGFNEYLSGNIPDFFNSYGFENMLSTDLLHANQLLNNNVEIIEMTIDNNKDTIINSAVDTYLTEKATIIENELKYAVENYDESYFDYEYTADAVDIPESATSHTSSEPLTDKNGNVVPRNIEAAKKILENCEGLEFLDYSALVRPSAFNEREYIYNHTLKINNEMWIVNLYNQNGYNLDETAIRQDFYIQYSQFRNNMINTSEAHYYDALEKIEKLSTIKYYIDSNNGKILKNTNNITSAEEFKKKCFEAPVYICYDDTGLSLFGLSGQMKDVATETLTTAGNSTIYMYFEYSGNNNDSYKYLYDTYNRMLSSSAYKNITIAAISVLISFILLIILLRLCGHHNDDKKAKTALIDKIPTDIHFLLSIGAVAFLTYIGVFLVIMTLKDTSDTNNLFFIYGPPVIATYFIFSYLIFVEWLSSTVRIIKSGHNFFSKMLISKIFFDSVNFFRKLFRALKKSLVTFRYKPKRIQRNAILLAVLYFFINAALAFATGVFARYFTGYIHEIIGAVLLIVFNSVCLFFFVRYVTCLDKIIDASCKHESVKNQDIKMPGALSLLASNLDNSNEAMKDAILKAVRDEQMKTELITNVSHDLKTPLTSLISYSDLLSKCDVKDETAQKYIAVINTQSIKLKRLIEDLIEASKVSTGNVTINATKLNLSELTMQVIAEFAPEMEKNGNEIVFFEPETPPTIFADGSKTYRILANLISNAKKYSAHDTRVYISVYSDNENGYFEIKNISSEPLNISPEELTERFVRGDKSRSKDGNGLGLSIAKDLCTLQNGKLELFIDGDLFKAKVILPS